MAGEYFVDTSAWYPLLVASHPDHERLAAATSALTAQRRRSVTTNLVVAEAHALILHREGRRAALVGLRAIDRAAVLVYSTGELESAARRDWLERYADQDFSLADAVSFTVMRERRIDDVLTLDRHFAAAGFRVAPATA